MRWFKRDMWKAGITITCMLLLLTLMVWLPVAAVGAQERAPELATPVTAAVQATPTEDATVTTLNKEKLTQEIQQLKNQNAPDPLGWLRTNSTILLSTLVVVIGGLIGLFRWFEDRRSEREKRAEERFQTVVTGLGDEKERTMIGAAIMLRTFLRPGYEQFYRQAFELAVVHLRLPRTSITPKDQNTPLPEQTHLNSETAGMIQLMMTRDIDTFYKLRDKIDAIIPAPLPFSTLTQVLSAAFKEAFPLARSTITSNNKEAIQSLDASGVQMDHAFLSGADFKQVWMPYASLQNTVLGGADISNAVLFSSNLSISILDHANLSGANLSQANLSGAFLNRADLSGADLSQANLSGANLNQVDLSGANLNQVDLSGADLNGTNLEDARSLEDTYLHGILGLTREQLEVCKARGAIIDEDSTPSSSQSTVSPSPLSPSNDVQASDTGDSNTSSPKPSPES